MVWACWCCWLIKTKSGLSGKWKFNYSGSTNEYINTDKFDVYTGTELSEIVQTSLQDRYNILGINDAAGSQVLYNTDWQDQIFQKAWGTTQDIVQEEMFWR